MIQGRKLRVDTTVVETNIHYPTDSSLLGDGARVLTRTMKKIESKAGSLKRKVRNRTRSMSKRVVAIATARRHKGAEGEAKRQEAIQRAAALLAADSESTPNGSSRKSMSRCRRKNEEGIATGCANTCRNDGGPGAAGGEANQGADLRGDHAYARARS